MGISTFPGEANSVPGAKLGTKDSRGFRANVCRSSNLWAGLFEVTIQRPASSRDDSPVARTQSNSVAALRRRLERAPATPAALRKRLIDPLSMLCSSQLREAMKASVGYLYDDESIDAFMDAIGDAIAVLRDGRIVGRSPAAELRELDGAAARADAPLQRFLMGLCAPGDGPDLDDSADPGDPGSPPAA